MSRRGVDEDSGRYLVVSVRCGCNRCVVVPRRELTKGAFVAQAEEEKEEETSTLASDCGGARALDMLLLLLYEFHSKEGHRRMHRRRGRGCRPKGWGSVVVGWGRGNRGRAERKGAFAGGGGFGIFRPPSRVGRCEESSSRVRLGVYTNKSHKHKVGRRD